MSIQNWLTLLLVLILLPLFVLQGYRYYDQYREKQEEALQANLEIARAVAKSFESFVQDVVRQELAIGLAITSRTKMTPGDITRLLETRRAYPAVRDFTWLNPEGVAIYSNNPGIIGTDFSDRSYVRDVVSGREWAVGELVVGKVFGKPIFGISRGIRDDRGNLLGVVFAAVVPDRLDAELAIERSEGGAISIVDRQGMLVYRYPAIDTKWEERNWLKQYPEYEEVFKGREISRTFFAAYEGKERLASIVPISSIGWAAGAGKRKEDVTGPIIQSLVRDAVLFLSISLIAFLIVVALSRKITKPVGALRTYASSLGNGEVSNKVDIEHVPELQDLAESFDTMAEKVRSRETALRESEGRYRALVESAPDAVLVHRDGQFLYANSRALNLYGAETLEQLQRSSVLDLIHPDDRPSVAERMRRGLAGHSLELRETKLVRLDGRVVPVESVGGMITYQGSPAVQIVVRDITARKQAEQQLALDLDAMTRLQKLGTLFVKEGSLGPVLTEIVDAAIAIAGADFGNIQLIDPASGDLRIATHRGFPRWWLDFWNSVAKGQGSCGTALERGERVIIEDVEQSPIFIGTPALDIQRKAGVRSVQSTPLVSRSGNPVGMFSTHHRTPRRPTDRELRLLDLLARQAADIIERAQAGEELRQSEERFRSVLESAADVMYRWNMQRGRFDYVSPSVEKVVGYTPDEIMAMSPAEALSLIHPDDVPVYQAAIVRLEETGMVEAEYRQRARDGEYRWLSNRMTFDRDTAGHSLYRHGSIRDITDRKLTETLLKADLAALTQMHALSGRLLKQEGLQSLLQDIMNAAVAIVSAEKGTLQLLEEDSLRIVAHHGHQQAFLDFFSAAENRASVCGEATRRGERVIVPNVETSPLFVGTTSLEVLRKAGVQAVQSTPMISRTGSLLGILTTQWGVPHTPNEHDLWRIDLLVRQASDLIEYSRTAEALRRAKDELEERVAERTYELYAASFYARSLIEASPDPLVTISLEGKINDVNRATEETTGVSREHLIGSDFSSYFTEPEKARAGYEEVFQRGLVRDYPLELKHRDGHVTPVLYNATLYRDEAGSVMGVFAAARDVTERKRAEEAVRAERQRLYDVLETLPVYAILLTPDYHVAFANRFFRERFGEDRGRRCYEYLFNRTEPCDICETYTVQKTGKPHHWEWNGPDGRHYDISDFPFIDADGSPLIMEVGIDITRRKEAEAALRKLASELVMTEERERKRIAGVLHDDVAQTLAAAKMRMDVIQEIPPGQEKALLEAKALLAQSIRETRALMTEIGNPLLFDMGLKAACESIADRLMESHPIRINCAIRDEYKYADPDVKAILFQVIRELLNNVVKHSQARNAHVQLDMEDACFRVKVTDDGAGFDPQMLGVPTVAGGFGLYSIRERLIAIGGSLRIESAPGHGTVVTVILPASLESPHNAEGKPT